jgi:serine/threonine-protein kinase
VADVLERLKAALADRYRIERELGSGGMATVYLADDLKLHRKVAVKVLRPELAAALGPDRFVQEIDIAAKLTHPHILPLHDCGDADGFLYYVMPHIEGESLRDKLAHEGELPIGEAVRILRDVVDALSEAHEKGVVHRDIKPDNVLLTKHHALVTDFGVAKALSEATSAQKLTTEGVALGTPAYMSPEQAAADSHIDHRADIYAVGVVAYELLTGRTPFLGTTPQMILSAHMTDTPDPVTKYRESVPPALEQLVMKCLEKKAADRWQSAGELLPQLEALATPSGGMTPTGTMPVDRVAKRRWVIAGVAVGVAAIVLIAILVSQIVAPSPITITTSNITRVTRDVGIEFQPAISPDGEEVAYLVGPVANARLVVRSTVDVGGGGE